MSSKVLFIERQSSDSTSIERVFRQIAVSISKKKYITRFEKVPYKSDALGIIKNLLFYKKSNSDIYHITGHIHFIAIILPSKNTILTIHDAGILNIRKGIRRYLLKKLLFDLPIKKLKYITAISEQTKKDIIFHTRCDAEKIRVIENPLRDEFYTYNNEKKQFNHICPTILQIGTSYNKNLINVIKSVCKINCKLRIIGKIDINIIDLLNSNSITYENVENLDDKEIVDEYKKADIVLFCSTFEGFGLPIIEAQAMKTPVITSNISPMKEVAGKGALLVDPHCFESIEQGINKVIFDVETRQLLISEGIDNVKRFRSSDIARKYEAFYEEILTNC